jgi:hypothetical protein
MLKSLRNKKSTWAAIGKLSVIVGILVGILNLSHIFIDSGPKLVGQVYYGKTGYPPEVTVGIKAVIDSIEKDNLKKLSFSLGFQI